MLSCTTGGRAGGSAPWYAPISLDTAVLLTLSLSLSASGCRRVVNFPNLMLQEQLRAEKLLAEEKQLTFRPSINHYYHTSRPQLRLSNPSPYLAHVQANALKRRESLLRMRAAAEVCLSVKGAHLCMCGISAGTAHISANLMCA